MGCVHAYIHMYIRVHIYVCTYIRVCTCVCMYACMYVNVYGMLCVMVLWVMAITPLANWQHGASYHYLH